ncbi:MAG: hypothetical protein ACU84J_06030, partial [Gammaproteobacteria bacterium]
RQQQAARSQEQARMLQQRFDKLAEKEQEWVAKSALQSDVDADNSRLQQARQAEKIRPLFDRFQAGTNELTALNRQVADSANDIRLADAEAQTAERRLQEAKQAFAEVDELKKQQVELQQYEIRIVESTAAGKALRQSEQALIKAKEALLAKQGEQHTLKQEQTGQEAR